MFCKIFLIPNPKDTKTLLSFLQDLSEDYQIITTNQQINNELKIQGKNSKLLSEIFPIADNITYEIHRKSRKILDEYRDHFKNIHYNKIEIFSSIENQILLELVLIEKVKEILNQKKDTFLIFDQFSYSFFPILELSLKLGYQKSDKNIFYISENSIIKINSYDKNPSIDYKNKLKFLETISQSQKSKPNVKKTRENESIQNYDVYENEEIIEKQSSPTKLKLISEVFPLFVKSNLFKVSTILGMDVKKSILNKVDKKIQSYSKNHETKSAFFLTSKRDDQITPLVQIINEYTNKQIPVPIFTFDLATKKVLDRKKINFVNLFEDAYILAEFLKKKPDGKNLIQQIENIDKSNSVSLFSSSQFRNYIINEVFRATAIMTICKYIFKILSLQSIVVEYGVTRNGNAVIAASKKFKIQSYNIITVLLGLNPILSNFYKSDKLCVYGTLALDQLLSLGYKKDNVFITGNPRYDDLKTQNYENNKNFLHENFQIDKTKKLVVIAMSRWHKGDEVWISNLIKFCNKNNFEIIIKVHPIYKFTENILHKGKIDYISKFCKGEKFLITFDIELTTLLSSADLAITDFSNAGIEAILLEKPLITVNFSKEDYSNVQRYHEYGASIYVDEYENIEQIILEILQEKKHIEKLKEGSKKIIEMYNAYNDGKASQRIFNILMKSKNDDST